MTRGRRFGWMVAGVLSMCVSAVGVAAPPDDATLPPDQTPAPRAVEQPADLARPAAPVGLGDYHLSAWLVVDQNQQVAIHEFAAQHAASEQVKQFAKQAAEGHRGFMTKLNAAGLSTVQSNEPQIGVMLREVAKQLRDSPGNPKKIVVGFRGVNEESPDDAAKQIDEAPPAETTPRIRVELKKSADVSPPETDRAPRDERRDADRRDDRREAREERRDDVRDEREEVREERADVRSERREAARGFLEQALPALRENLPEILDLVGEAIDDSAQNNQQRQVVALWQQISRRHTESVKQELGKHEGAAFDHAFLHYEILSHMQLIDTLQVVQQHASPQLRPTIDEGLSMTQNHLAEARRMLDEIQQPSASESR